MKKVIGWVGIVDGKPYFEKVHDAFDRAVEDPTPRLEVFRSRKQASKRFQAVVKVEIRPLESWILKQHKRYSSKRP